MNIKQKKQQHLANTKKPTLMQSIKQLIKIVEKIRDKNIPIPDECKIVVEWTDKIKGKL